MKISLVRGAFLNPFELQNFYPLKNQFDITAISSKHPISEDIDLPLIKLYSPTDLPNFPYKYPILNRIFTDAHYLFGLEKAITGSDIVHTAETYYHYTIQAIKAKQKGLINKIISTVWEIIPHNNEGIHGRQEFKRLTYEHVDHFLAVTNLAKIALIKEGVNPKKITVIPMGVDTNRFSPAQKECHPKLNILFVGRFSAEKGVGDLVSAFSEIYKNNKNISLTLVGSGPLNKIISNQPGITVKNMIYSQIHRVYQNADIFCLPSRTSKYWQEQFGMVLVEAMASGLPIITTATGAIEEVCSTAAIYADENNSNDLINKIELLLYNQDLRVGLGKIARDRAVSKFDCQNISKQIAKLYHHVC
jgi:alpha-maltose-1-phosphate synthase